jgi:hypothetical protein
MIKRLMEANLSKSTIRRRRRKEGSNNQQSAETTEEDDDDNEDGEDSKDSSTAGPITKPAAIPVNVHASVASFPAASSQSSAAGAGASKSIAREFAELGKFVSSQPNPVPPVKSSGISSSNVSAGSGVSNGLLANRAVVGSATATGSNFGAIGSLGGSGNGLQNGSAAAIAPGSGLLGSKPTAVSFAAPSGSSSLAATTTATTTATTASHNASSASAAADNSYFKSKSGLKIRL